MAGLQALSTTALIVSYLSAKHFKCKNVKWVGFFWLKARRRMISLAFLCTERLWASRRTAADSGDDNRWRGNTEESIWGEKEKDDFCSSQISFLQYLFGLSLLWNSRLADTPGTCHHNCNPISHLSQLPIATWEPIQECDSSMSDVICTLTTVLRVVVCCYIIQGNLWELAPLAPINLCKFMILV